MIDMDGSPKSGNEDLQRQYDMTQKKVFGRKCKK